VDFTHLHTLSNTKIAEELLKTTGDEARFPKSDIRHWQQAVFRRRYQHKNRPVQVGHYSVQLMFRRTREEFALGTANRAAAAARAKEIYQFLVANGWDATIAKFKPDSEREHDGTISTVGEFIQAIQATSPSRGRTLAEYIRCFRRIVASAFGIEDSKKFDYRRGGRKRWLERVHAVPLVRITPQRVQQWKVDFLARAGQGPTSQRTARISVNSALRGARSLFSARRIKFINLAQGFVSPFSGVPLEPRQSMRYRSGFDVEALVRSAVRELADSDPEALKIVLLGALCGLRRGEIDRLTWQAFDFSKRTLHIEPNEHFQPKTEDSIGAIDLDSELVDLFRRFKQTTTSPFVVESQVLPKANVSYAHYRCQTVFERVTGWLHIHGVPGKKPLHLLRKEYGSRICDRYGIYIASRMLRHSDVATTAAHYVDKKATATVCLGHLLSPPTSEPPSNS
jgi:integrase